MSNKLHFVIDRDFTVAPNQVFKDRRLSYKAKGLFCQIISLPEGWDFSIKGLSLLAKEAERAIKTGLDELVDCGYLEWIKTRTATNQFCTIVNITLPEPSAVLPDGKMPQGDLPQGKTAHNKELIDKDLNNKENTNTWESVDSVVSIDSKAKRAAIWEALVSELKYTDTDITKNVRGQLNNATKQLFDVGATGDDVHIRSRMYRDLFKTSTFTAMALVNRWADLRPTMTHPSKLTSGVDYDDKGRDFKFDAAGDVIL